MGAIAEAFGGSNDSIEREWAAASKARIDVTPDGGTFDGVTLEAPVTDGDWSRVFRIFNLDPAEFEVVDDTVRMSTWQQSKGLEDGTRDIAQLWSYSARFKRKPKQRLPEADIEALRAQVKAFKPSRRAPKPKAKVAADHPVAAVINLADIQGGKSEGGGVKATTQRLLDGLENVQAWLDRQRQHYNVTELVIVNNGDPMENCAGNYAAQLFTVELNLRQQMNYVLDMWTLYARTLYPQFERGQFVSVLCNHGEFGRMGGAKNQTSDSDNAGGFLAETLRRVLSASPEFDHIEWTIPHDEMVVYPTIAGVPCAATHGHKIQGADAGGFEKWLNGQVRGDDGAHAARLWFTAHRHNYQAFDLGSTFVLQMPSLDGGSKWLRDMTGKYSRTGIVAGIVDPRHPLCWAEGAFL